MIARRTRETLRSAWVDQLLSNLTWQYQIPTFNVNMWNNYVYITYIYIYIYPRAVFHGHIELLKGNYFARWGT